MRSSVTRLARDAAAIFGGVFAAEKLFDFGKSVVSEAAQVQKAGETVDATFGQSAERVRRFSDTAARSLGLSRSLVLTSAQGFGLLFHNLGISTTKAADMTVNIQKLAGSLSLIKGTDPTQALQALNTALVTGSTRGLRDYGVALGSAQVKAEALRLGLLKGTSDASAVTAAQDRETAAQQRYNDAVTKYGQSSAQSLSAHASLISAQEALTKATQGTTGALDPAIRSQSIYQLLIQNLPDYLQQAQKHSGDLANQEKILTAQWENAKATIGEELLPAISSLVSALSKYLPGALHATLHAFHVTFDAVVPIVQPARNVIASLFRTVGGLFDLLRGHGPLRLRIAWDDLQSAAARLLASLRTIILGSTGHAKPLMLPSGKFLEFDTTGATTGIVPALSQALRNVDWSTVGSEVAAGISKTFRFTASQIGTLVTGLLDAVNQNKNQIATVGITIAVTILSDLLDPVFWAQHWRLAMDVALTALTFEMPGVSRLAKALPFVRRFAELLHPLGDLLVRAGRGALLAMFEGMEHVFPSLSRLLSRTVEKETGRVVTSLKNPFESVPGWFTRQLRQIFVTFGEALGLTAREAGRYALDIVNVLLRPFRFVVGFYRDLFTRVLSTVRGLLGDLLHAVGSRVGAIPRIILSVAGDVLHAAADLGARIVRGVISGVGSLGSSLKSSIESHVKSALSTLNPFSPVEHGADIYIGSPIVAGALSGLSPFQTKITQTISDALQHALGAARRLAAGMTEVGTAMRTGTLSGVAPLAEQLGRAITSALDAAISAARRHLGISSPSALFRDRIGVPLKDGILAGLGGLEQAVQRKVTDAARAAQASMGGIGGGPAGSGAVGANQQLGRRMMLAAGWGADQWGALQALWTRESGWNQYAKNPSSGAYGIPQSLPASKMASAGADWLTNAATQIRWGLSYIRGRYGSPAEAWQHELSAGWYDRGGWLPPGLSLALNQTGRPERVLAPSQSVANDYGLTLNGDVNVVTQATDAYQIARTAVRAIDAAVKTTRR